MKTSIRLSLLALLASVLLSVAAPAARGQCVRSEEALLVSTQPSNLSYLGWSVAVSGDTLLAGARLEADPASGTGEGAAYVFRRVGGVWALEQRLAKPAAMSQASFGLVAALDGDIAVVGNAQAERELAVFRRTGNAWGAPVMIAAPSTVAYSGFGRDIDLDGTSLIVGADAANPLGTGSTGAAYVFVESGGVWTEEAQLVPPAASALPAENFGWSVSIDGDVALVGAMNKDSARGSAYVFRRSGTTWSFEVELAPVGVSGGERAGYSTAIRGDVAVVGAIGDTTGSVNEGVVRVYRRSAGAWALEQMLRPIDNVPGDRFASTLALDGDRLAVTSQFGPSAYLFEHRLGVWNFLTKLTPSGLNAFWTVNYRGEVALSGDTVALGAPANDVSFSSDGTVVVFDIGSVSPVCTYCTAKTDSAGCTPALVPTGTPSASAASGFTIQSGAIANRRMGTLLYSLGGPQALSFSGGLNCLRAPQRTTTLSSSGGSALPVQDCSGQLGLDFNAWRASGPHPQLVAGRQVFAQFWYRDSAGSTGLSDALQFILEP